MREAIMWSHLSHPNLLPFYGIYQVDERLGCVCLVSPWMRNGNINEYLKAHLETPRLPLVHDILAGLKHLHKQSVVHGDLKGANILISNSGSALLADFGLSSMVDSEILRWTSLNTMTQVGGTVRWQAPELMDHSEDGFRPTFSADVYSVASVMYEVLTDQLPFYEAKNDMAVMSRIVKGLRPTRPSADKTLEISAAIWEVMESCWSHTPGERPPADQVAEKLAGIPPTALTIRRMGAQKLGQKQDVKGNTLTPVSFRAAMRGKDTGFSKTDVNILQECAKGCPLLSFDPKTTLPRFGDHDTNSHNFMDTPSIQMAVKSDSRTRAAPSEAAAEIIQNSSDSDGSLVALKSFNSLPPLPDLRSDLFGPLIPPFGHIGARRQKTAAYDKYEALCSLNLSSWSTWNIHPLFGGESWQSGLLFNLSAPDYLPTVFGAGEELLSNEGLYVPFILLPMSTSIEIVCDLIPQWPLHIAPDPPDRSPAGHYMPSIYYSILMADVLKNIYVHFRTAITYTDWAQLDPQEQKETTKAYTSRCKSLGPREVEERSCGVRRIDYSKGKVWFKGLTKVADSLFTFKLHLG